MKLLIASAAPFHPGGPNLPLLAVIDLVRALARRGAEPALLCRDPRAPGATVTSHDGPGFPVFGAADPAAAAPTLAVAGEAAALVLLEGGDGRLTAACSGLALPVLAWFTRPPVACPPAPPPAVLRLVADGPAVAAAVAAWYGRAPALLSMPAPPLAVVPSREHALMLDPTPAGGIEIALALAAVRPRTIFVIAEAEPLPAAWRAACFARAAGGGAIDWRSGGAGGPTEPFARARVLLMPALAPDADPWPLRAAQAVGVPALTADHGALPDALGAAGVLVPPDAGVDGWLAGFDRLWNDAAIYQATAAAAAHQAGALSADAIADALLSHVAALCAGSRAA